MPLVILTRTVRRPTQGTIGSSVVIANEDISAGGAGGWRIAANFSGDDAAS